MQNHARCLANEDGISSVDFIGFSGSDLPTDIQENEKIKVRYMSTKIIDKLKKLP